MKAVMWFGALSVLGASTIAAVPAFALTCWTPSELAPVDFVSRLDSPTSYVDCFGAGGLHAEAQGLMGSSAPNIKNINVTVYNGDLARVWGYDANRNFIPGCFVEKQGIGTGLLKVCSTSVRFIQLEAWDN